jgi:hypothetical protein
MFKPDMWKGDHLITKAVTFPYSEPIVAVHIGNISTVQALLDHIPRLTWAKASGSALHLATGQGNLEIVMLLLEHGADVNCGRTIYQPAQVGVEPKHRCPLSDGTPLEAACTGGHVRIVNILLDPTYNFERMSSLRECCAIGRPSRLRGSEVTGIALRFAHTTSITGLPSKAASRPANWKAGPDPRWASLPSSHRCKGGVRWESGESGESGEIHT